MKFRMVDRITVFEACKSIRAAKTVSFEEYRLRSAFGDWPSLPESLLLESLFQAASWLVIISSDFTKTSLVTSAEEVRFVGSVGPGDVLALQVETKTYCGESVRFDGRAEAAGRIIADVKGGLARVEPLAEYADPADMKVWFSELYRPDMSAMK